MANELLAAAYDTVDPAKAKRLRECANFLIFRTVEKKKILDAANFCHVRLCPICAWRRSRKIFRQVLRIHSAIKAEQPMGYLFLTLTVKNCSGEELSGTIDHLVRSFNKFIHGVNFKRVVKGWYRGLEVTHNLVPGSDSYDTYHPHFHMLLAVKLTYFSSQHYLSQKRWQEMWKRAARLDYEPQVDIRRVKGNTAAAIAEVAKYAAKEADYLFPDDWDLTVDTVRLLDSALANRRFVGFGGLFADWHKKLHLDDEDGDLIHTDPDEPVALEDLPRYVYTWFSGYRQYLREE